MMKGEAARQRAWQHQGTVRAARTTTLGCRAHTAVGSAESPELCQHRRTSSRTRDGLPCLQERHGRYSSKEELLNEEGGKQVWF